MYQDTARLLTERSRKCMTSSFPKIMYFLVSLGLVSACIGQRSPSSSKKWNIRIQGYSLKLNPRRCWVCQKCSRLSIYPRERHEGYPVDFVCSTYYVGGSISQRSSVYKEDETRSFLSDMQSTGISTDKTGGRISLNRFWLQRKETVLRLRESNNILWPSKWFARPTQIWH
jgi:hypothetical protein